VFVTDCLSTILFKDPPNITITEMTGDLPVTDAIFDATTPAEFTELVATSTHRESQMRSLKDIVQLLLHGDHVNPDASNLAFIGLEHLSMLMFGQYFCSIAQDPSKLTYNSAAFYSVHVALRASATIDTRRSSSRHQSLEGTLAHGIFQRHT
jgi:hypothetical protein